MIGDIEHNGMKTSAMGGVAHLLLCETPIAVVDLETTGFCPGGDRIIELAVVRVEPRQEPELLLDTLVNPRRPVFATEIHGITNGDVADAPTFEEVAGKLLEAISGCVFASYNVYFDGKFVQAELTQVGFHRFPPQVCLMYLRPLLGLGSKCSLADACQQHAIHHSSPHCASTDALASARLWQFYIATGERAGIRTFGDLVKRRAYKFTDSFTQDPLDISLCAGLRSTAHFKARVFAASTLAPIDRQVLVGEYWSALTSVFADLEVTPNELQYLLAKSALLNLTPDELRWLHARVFAGILAEASQDRAITSKEATVLHTVMTALRHLGWAPGDMPDVQSGN
ncbi:MAG: 3'-5' exonuclease [Bryobacteraceae bacterium]